MKKFLNILTSERQLYMTDSSAFGTLGPECYWGAQSQPGLSTNFQANLSHIMGFVSQKYFNV